MRFPDCRISLVNPARAFFGKCPIPDSFEVAQPAVLLRNHVVNQFGDAAARRRDGIDEQRLYGQVA